MTFLAALMCNVLALGLFIYGAAEDPDFEWYLLGVAWGLLFVAAALYVKAARDG